jgi:hypothetical protein
MPKLRRLALLTVMILSIAGVIHADGGAPICNPDPGQTNTPPCAMAQPSTDDSDAASGASVSATPNDPSDYSITEFTLDVVENLLALF